MISITIIFKKRGTSGSPVYFGDVSFFQYHDNRLTVMQNFGKNEYHYAANDIVSIEIAGFPMGFPIVDKKE